MSELLIANDLGIQKFVVMLDMLPDGQPEIMDVQLSDIGIMFESHRASNDQEDEVTGSLSVTWRDICSFLETRKMMEDNGL
tara:strand:- start:1081 stop:1323 length:243 start_codon:yes stop_codon:yes gene_type:complete